MESALPKRRRRAARPFDKGTPETARIGETQVACHSVHCIATADQKKCRFVLPGYLGLLEARPVALETAVERGRANAQFAGDRHPVGAAARSLGYSGKSVIHLHQKRCSRFMPIGRVVT